MLKESNSLEIDKTFEREVNVIDIYAVAEESNEDLTIVRSVIDHYGEHIDTIALK